MMLMSGLSSVHEYNLSDEEVWNYGPYTYFFKNAGHNRLGLSKV